MKNVYSVTQDERVLDLLYTTVPVVSKLYCGVKNLLRG